MGENWKECPINNIIQSQYELIISKLDNYDKHNREIIDILKCNQLKLQDDLETFEKDQRIENDRIHGRINKSRVQVDNLEKLITKLRYQPLIWLISTLGGASLLLIAQNIVTKIIK